AAAILGSAESAVIGCGRAAAAWAVSRVSACWSPAHASAVEARSRASGVMIHVETGMRARSTANGEPDERRVTFQGVRGPGGNLITARCPERRADREIRWGAGRSEKARSGGGASCRGFHI